MILIKIKILALIIVKYLLFKKWVLLDQVYVVMVESQKNVNPVKIGVVMVGNVVNAENVVVHVCAYMEEGSHDAKNVMGMLVVFMAFAKIVSCAVVLPTVHMA